MSPESTWGGRERREFVRVSRSMKVHCKVMQKPEVENFDAPGEDISRSGVLIISRSNLPLGTEVRVKIESESDGISLDVDGVVRRCDRLTVPGEPHYEVGVEFVNMDDDQRDGIVQVISSPPGKERRQYVRLRRAFAIRFKTSLLSGWKDATAHDLSAGGLMFTMRQPPAMFAHLKLRIQLGRGREVKVNGRVVAVEAGSKVHPARVHVTFHDTGGKARREIGHFISELLQPERDEPEEQPQEGDEAQGEA